MTTRDQDGIGRQCLNAAGARSAPEVTCGFPGATCISVGEETAHGIPGKRALATGDVVNIDVLSEKGGFFVDTGATFRLGKVSPDLEGLCRDGKRAMQLGLAEVGHGRPLPGLANAIRRFAAKRGFTLIGNRASHGIGCALHGTRKRLRAGRTWAGAASIAGWS